MWSFFQKRWHASDGIASSWLSSTFRGYCQEFVPMVPNAWEKASGLAWPNARPHANPTECLAGMSRVARWTFHECLDSVYPLNLGLDHLEDWSNMLWVWHPSLRLTRIDWILIPPRYAFFYGSPTVKDSRVKCVGPRAILGWVTNQEVFLGAHKWGHRCTEETYVGLWG
jgi:hypothetical protein